MKQILCIAIAAMVVSCSNQKKAETQHEQVHYFGKMVKGLGPEGKIILISNRYKIVEQGDTALLISLKQSQ